MPSKAGLRTYTMLEPLKITSKDGVSGSKKQEILPVLQPRDTQPT